MSKKDNKTMFEKLERLNAQIDVWIDEEDYDAIRKHIGYKYSDDFYKDACNTLYDTKKTCSNNDDIIWQSFLIESHNGRELPPPIAAVKLTDGKIANFNIDKFCDVSWSRLFWAKLLRAIIMQKGTDCFYRRLDSFMIYLERNIPVPSSKDALKFHIIYLLELATYGIGADWKSFAERARRILRDPSLKGIFGKDEKRFVQFYDLVSRYSKGIYYFHEGKDSYERAVSEFDYIIKTIDREKRTRDWHKYFDYRKGYNLLYLPAVIYTSEVFLKLQLAFHSVQVLKKYLKNPSEYKKAKSDCLNAESYIYLGEYDEARNCLNGVIQKYLGDRNWPLDKPEVEWQRIFHDLDENTLKWSALKGRLLGQMFAEILSRLKSDGQVEVHKDHSKYNPENLLRTLDHLCKLYWKLSEKNKSERNGFLEQLAEGFVQIKDVAAYFDKNNKHDWSGSCRSFSDKIYTIFSDRMIPSKKVTDKKACQYCDGNKNVNFNLLKQEHLEEYKKNIFNFHKWITTHPKEKDKFEKAICDHKDGYNSLEWEIYKRQSNSFRPQFECKQCLPSSNKSFHGLLVACPRISPPSRANASWGNADMLNCIDYENIMKDWEDHFYQDHLVGNTVHLPMTKHMHFLGLQRWNSSSPAMGKSVGGGYLLYHTDDSGKVDLGVAVDPGFDFVRNLFQVGFSLADVDVVLMSHGHVDHVRDFESMLTLLLELKKKDGSSRKLHAIMTSGVYARLKYLIENPGFREFVEPYIIDVYKDLDEDYINNLPDFCFSYNKNERLDKNTRWRPQVSDPIRTDTDLSLVIKPQKAYHNDHSYVSDSFGFIVELEQKGGTKYAFGYTGDTKWHPEIVPQFMSCNVLLVHIGSLINRSDSDKEEEKSFKHYNQIENCFSLVTNKNHPYLPGLFHFMAQYAKTGNKGPKGTSTINKKRLVLVSEFGEELRGGIRRDLNNRLRGAYDNLEVLPVDVGLDVLLEPINGIGESSSNRVMCVQCEKPVEISLSCFETYGHDEAIFCICSTCKKSTPLNVLQDKLRSLYETGNMLRK